MKSSPWTRRAPSVPVLAAVLAVASAVFACRAPGAEAPAPQAQQIIRRGGVTFFVPDRRIEVNGKFCLTEGPLELFACAEGGKAYESVISLYVNPEILTYMLILMRLKPGTTGPEFQGDPKHAPTGSPVILHVRWKDAKGEHLVRAEELCWNALDKRTMDPTHWVFSGSKWQEDPQTHQRIFVANIEKTIVAVYRDPSAVIDLPLDTSANSGAYVVNTRLVPKIDTPCTLIIEPSPEQPAEAKNAQGGRIAILDVTLGGRVLLDGQSPYDIERFSEGYVPPSAPPTPPGGNAPPGIAGGPAPGQAPAPGGEAPAAPPVPAGPPVEAQAPAVAKALRALLKGEPKTTLRVAMDHGAPACAAAAAFLALAEAKAPVESAATNRVRPDVQDALVLTVAGEAIAVQGKEVTAAEARELVRGLLKPGTERGVAIQVERGASLKAVGEALRACDGLEGIVLRLIWPAPETPAPAK